MSATTLALVVVVGLMLVLLPRSLEKPCCPLCGGRLRHGRKCPYKDFDLDGGAPA